MAGSPCIKKIIEARKVWISVAKNKKKCTSFHVKFIGKRRGKEMHRSRRQRILYLLFKKRCSNLIIKCGKLGNSLPLGS